MTLNELRAALDRIEVRFGNSPVVVWLPGSRIDLAGLITVKPGRDGEILVEGNVRAGSALDDITEHPENRALKVG